MFSDVLRQLRLNANLNQEELAKKLGCSKSAISMYENGTREPNLETLEAIADYFNVDMNTLTDSKTSAELNSELQEYLEELKNRSEMRMLFSLAKGATKEDVEKAVRIIEALQKDEWLLGDIYIRGIELPLTVKGVTVLDSDGNFNVYINILLSHAVQQKATKHELKHIKSEHFYDYEPVVYNELEANAI